MVRFTDTGGEADTDGLAPVIPLFGAATPVADQAVARPSEGLAAWNSTWGHEPAGSDHEYDECGAIEREIAEKSLLRRLRTRSLSLREARAVVAERDLDDEAIDSVLAAFQQLGYLDDAALAEQLVHAGSDRKGQGRQAIAQTLAKRGIPRDIADAALAELPDDDAERALEYAQAKARSFAGVDRETALRRLVGQLVRRGYSGSVALRSARSALDAGPGSGGVRFD